MPAHIFEFDGWFSFCIQTSDLDVQGYYLQAPFPVERAPTAPLPAYSGSRRFKDVRVYQLAEYPVRGLVFECGQNLPDMADFVAEVCVRLQEGNIPHNLFIVDCGMRVFLYPNAFAAAKAEVSRSFVDHALIPDVIFACNRHQLMAFTQICLGALQFMQRQCTALGDVLVCHIIY